MSWSLILNEILVSSCVGSWPSIFISVNCNKEFWHLSPDQLSCYIHCKGASIFNFLNWNSLVMARDSWFFTRWVPGFTITICNKITGSSRFLAGWVLKLGTQNFLLFRRVQSKYWHFLFHTIPCWYRNKVGQKTIELICS